MKLGIIQDTTVEVDRLPEREYTTQVYVRKDFGAERMFEEKMLVVECDESVA